MLSARISFRLRVIVAIALGGSIGNLLMATASYGQDLSNAQVIQHHVIELLTSDASSEPTAAPVAAGNVSSSYDLLSDIPQLATVDTQLDQPVPDPHSFDSTIRQPATQTPSIQPEPDSQAPQEVDSELPVMSESINENLSTHAADLLNRPAYLTQLAEIDDFTTFIGLQSKQDEMTVPEGSGEIISDIEVRFVDEDGEPINGLTRDFIITREFDIQPGDSYDPELAQNGLARVVDLDPVRQASLTLEPTDDPDQAIMVVTVEEGSGSFDSVSSFADVFAGDHRYFVVIPDIDAPEPSVLQGPTLPRPVTTHPLRFSAFRLPLRFGTLNLGGNDQDLLLSVIGGLRVGGVDLTFSDPWIAGTSPQTGYGLNGFALGYISPIFTGGPRDIELAGGETPWVHRWGGGAQITREFSDTSSAALGISYQRVTVRDDLFILGSDLVTEDELGNPLTISEDGRDDLLTLNFAYFLDRRDRPIYPTDGFRFRFGTDQSIPVGEADILHNRLSANYVQFVPLNLFGFDEGPRTLILNVQGGTVIGDLPPYEAFTLGGSSSVRGFPAGDVGSGRSFVQATAEYRFPILSFRIFGEEIPLRGSLFFDVASDLGSDETVVGRPAEVRDKPGFGFGGGPGILAESPFGLVRFEVGFGSEGDTVLHFNVGDRF
ncbi:MAG: BamA/TamA family outer membrane protein [Elainellaceae cyanobacterium]